MVDLASPHIAGHSYEGKLNGTVACYNELCNFFEIQKSWDITASLPEPPVPLLKIDGRERDDEEILHTLIRSVYDIETDDLLIREAAATDEIDRAQKFDALRAGYRVRREFMNTQVLTQNCSDTVQQKIRALGFSCT
jgi:erythronate-4-phosphate dehydrogenase